MLKIQVAFIGAGPVGLLLGYSLRSEGIKRVISPTADWYKRGSRFSTQKRPNVLEDFDVIFVRLSLMAEETKDVEGFRRGRNLDKIGLEMGDTAEFFFEDVQVPSDNLIGGESGHGMYQLMKELLKERLIIALGSLAIIESALAHTLACGRGRNASGKRFLDFQTTQFKLAECKTEANITRNFCDDCMERCLTSELNAATASLAKYWLYEQIPTCTNVQERLCQENIRRYDRNYETAFRANAGDLTR